MSLVSVPEAARLLGVDESRVRARIADGSLRAERIGGRWAIDEADLAPLAEAGPGRPLSVSSAWALLDAAAAYPAKSRAADLPPSIRLRARQRLAELLDSLPAEPDEDASRLFAARLRALIAKRADRHLFRASPRDLPDLRVDDRVRLSGLSAPASGIASGELVEGYVSYDDLDALSEEYLLSPARGAQANVILHVMPTAVPPSRLDPDLWLLLAADLAEHRGAREEARAVSIVLDALAAKAAK